MRTTSFFPLTAFLAAVSLLLSGCSSLPGTGDAGTVPETEETQGIMPESGGGERASPAAKKAAGRARSLCVQI